MITVSFEDQGQTFPEGARYRWLSITPWIGARFQKHVAIEGGQGIGRHWDRGHDNRVATLTGLVQWNADGEAILDMLGGSILMVKNGATDTAVRCIADAPTVTDAGANIRFTLTLTEVKE